MQQLNIKILNDIIWEKPNPPPNLLCKYFTHSPEIIVCAAKSAKSKHAFNYDTMRKINCGKQMKNVLRLSAPGPEEKEFGKHPTQKPLHLLERIITASANEHNLIFDPFAGSGTTGVPATALNRNFIGFELSQEYVTVAQKRLFAVIKAKFQNLNFLGKSDFKEINF